MIIKQIKCTAKKKCIQILSAVRVMRKMQVLVGSAKSEVVSKRVVPVWGGLQTRHIKILCLIITHC